MPRNLLIAGPPGAGKSAAAARALAAASQPSIVIEFTGLWALLNGLQRDDRGAYPTRRDDDPTSGLVARTMAGVARDAIEADVAVIAAVSRRTQIDWWQDLLSSGDSTVNVEVVDPGRPVAEANLRVRYGPTVPEVCIDALDRWYVGL